MTPEGGSVLDAYYPQTGSLLHADQQITPGSRKGADDGSKLYADQHLVQKLFRQYAVQILKQYAII